jgi:hypothetical protein
MVSHSVKRAKRHRGLIVPAVVALFLFLLLFLPHTTLAQTVYTWNGGANGNWQTASNWTPARTTTATTDILVFSNTTATLTNIPAWEEVGEFQVTNGSVVTLQTTEAILTVGAANCLTIQDACSLILSGTNQIELRLRGNNSNINGSGKLVFTGGDMVMVTGILKLNDVALIDFKHASAKMLVSIYAELQVRSTGATINFDAPAAVIFSAATAAGQTPSTLRFSNAATLSVTGAGSGMLAFGYYYNSGSFMAVQPRILSGMGVDAATLRVTGATKHMNVFSYTGGAEGIDIPGDLMLTGGGTLNLLASYPNQNVRIYGEMFGANLLTIKSGTTLENQTVLQSNIRMAVEGTFVATGPVYNSRNISAYGTGKLDIKTMNFWSYASIDLYDAASIRLLTSDGFFSGVLHTYSALNIHGTGAGNSIYTAPTNVAGAIDFYPGSSLNFQNNAVLNVTGASCMMQFSALSSLATAPLTVSSGGTATLHLVGTGDFTLYGGTNYYESRAGFAIDGTLNITGTAPVIANNALLLKGNGSNSAIYISTTNSLSVMNSAYSSLSVEECTLEIGGAVNVGANGALYVTPGTTASTELTVDSTGSLTVDGTLNLMPDVGSFRALLTSNAPVTINDNAGVNIHGGTLVLNDASLKIQDNPTFLATSGTVQYNGTSSLLFEGSVPHIASGELATTALVNVVMNNSGGVTFTTDATITGMLDLTDGLIYMTTGTLFIQDVQNASDSSYVVGSVQQYVAMSPTIFPIGDTSAFLPLVIRYVDNGGTVRAAVRQTNPTDGRSGMAGSAVPAVWNITAIDPMPSSAQVGFVWPTSIEPSNFSADYAAPARWTGSAWESYRDEVMFRDSGYVYIAGVTGFSPWAVFGGYVANFVTQPTDITAGSAFSPAVTVEILDPTSATRLVDDNTTQIVISHSGGSNVSLTGTTTQTVSNGVATFTGLGMTGSQTGIVYLTASTPYSSTTSALFTFTGGPAQLGVTTVLPASPKSGEDVEITVEIQGVTGSVTSATMATVVGVNFSNPYLYVMGSTEATIGVGNTSGTIIFAFYNSSNATITTTLTITGGDLASTTVTVVVRPACDNYELDFSDDQVVVTDPGVSSLDVSGDITLELWMQHNGRLTGNSSYTQKIAGKGIIGQGSYGLFYDGETGDYLFLLSFDGSRQDVVHIPQSAISQGAWTHLAGTYNAVTREMAFYANGQQMDAVEVDAGWTRTLTNDDVFDIGRFSSISAFSFDGRVDEVRVWNTARTAEQLRSTMYTRLAVPVPGLAGYWRMDEGRGTVAFDISGNGNHGTITGAEYKNSSTPLPAITGEQFLCNSPQAVYGVPFIEGASYNWSVTNGSIISGQSSSTATIALAGETTGTVSVAISKVDGCVVSTSMTATYYTPLVAQAGAATELCFDQYMLIGGSPTASGGSGSFAYQWSPTTGLDDPSAANPQVIARETTTYTVTVTDLVSGCQAVSTATIVVDPVVSSALSLDGDGDYITAPAGVWFNGDYTVEGWVNLREADYWARFIDFGNGPNADNIAFILSVDNNGPVAIRHFNGSSFSSEVVTPDNLPLNQWVHLAFVLDGTVGRIYKNGELWAEAGGQSIPGNVVRNNNYIGHPNWSADPDSKVMFDDIRFWNVARTQEQIQQMMNASLTGSEPGLMANYRLDEGKGALAMDASPNGRNAVIEGDPVWVSRIHISGEQNICGNESAGRTYSVAAVANTDYNWAVTGGTITAVNTTVTTSSVTVVWNGGPGTVSVVASATGVCPVVSTSLTVIVNSIPVVSASDITTDEDTPTTAIVTVTDVETANESLVITVTSGNTSLLVDEAIHINVTSGTIALSMMPIANQWGAAPVTVTVNDGCAVVSTTFTLTVNSVNDLPIASDITIYTIEDHSTSAVLVATDVESTTLTYSIAVHSTMGTAVVNSTTNTFTYTPFADANGFDTFVYQVSDGDGGISTAIVSIFIEPVNDVPVFSTGANQMVNEDAGAQTVANWATGISAGPANESGQTLTFVTSNNNSALFSVQPSISTTGTLSYTPAADAFGVATVEVMLTDNGGTANGGVSTSTIQSFTITVRSVNDAPVFSTGANQIVSEDAGAQTVANWATGISTGPANESDQSLSFVVSNDNTALFAVQPAVSSTGTLTFTPADNRNGVAVVSIYAMDNGGTANGGVSTSTVQVFTITVSAVNDAPSFIGGTDQIVDEDAGVQTVANWATGISAGPANESGQSLSFVVSNNNSALFSVQPSISTTGTLSYTPAADAFGVATVEVMLTDNGGTANGGVSTSTIQSFTITVRSVNDAPVLSTGANQIVSEDAGAQMVSNWATGISTGPTNESDQSLSFVVSNDNTALFAIQPVVSSTGTLSYTPADDASGTAVVSVYAMDNGGTANGGISTSSVQMFTIVVNAINDAPIASDDTDSLCSGGTRTIDVLKNDTDIEQNVLSISAVTQGSKGSVSILPGNTQVVYAPLGGEIFGWDTFTYTVADGEGGSSTATVSVLILPPVEADAGNDTTVCSGSSIRFNGEGVSYIGAIKFEWSPTTGVSNPSIADPVVTPTTTTTYTLTVIDGFGCSATDQITVTVVPAAVTTLSPNTTICSGGSTQLEATGGVSYVWSPAAGLNSTTTPVVSASPSTTTTYSVQITTADGCVVSRFVTVTVAPMATASAGPDVSLCVGSSVQLVATGGTTYSWSPATGLSNPNVANPLASPTATTTYTVIITNAGGCSSSTSVTVTVNPVALDVHVLLEGPYDGGGMMSTGLDAQGLVPVNQPYNTAPFNYTGTETRTVTSGTAVVDWVLVDLRNGAQSGNLVERHAGLLLADGRIIAGDGSGLAYTNLTPGGSYYVVVWHRNHLSVMSSVAVNVNNACELPYTFMSSPNAAFMQFAEGQKQVGAGVYGMIAGDADANGLINAIDRVMTRNTSGLTGYRTEDVSLDGIVNAVDRVFVRNNTFRVSQVP